MNLADLDPITLPDSVVSDIRKQGKTKTTDAAMRLRTEGAEEAAIANTA
ncbi:hypothetical protein [Burkholderia sp. LS-044]|nr:hypothetical protein [Burkholderia sp. LS-044]